MTIPCFHNQIYISSDNNTFTDTAGRTLTVGWYTWDTLRTEFLARWNTAGKRFAISSTGFITLDNNGGAAFDITWNEADLRDLLGFTGTLTGANTYTAPRRMRGAFYPNYAIREHDPKPMNMFTSQSKSNAGVIRTSIGGHKVNHTTFIMEFVDGTTELTSPTGYFGTSYSGLGITEYSFARDVWWDATELAAQGWCDGRPVRYFADRSDAAITAASGASAPYTVTDYSTWVFAEDCCKDWDNVAKKMRPPKTVHYRLTIPASEWIDVGSELTGPLIDG